MIFHLRQCACYFDTSGTTTDNHNIEQFLSLGFAGAGESALKIFEQGVAESHGFTHILHGNGVLFHVFIAEEVGGCSCRKDQIVVRNLTNGGLENLLVGEYTTHLSHAEIKILTAMKKFAEGERDTAGLDASRSHLIDERWELVVVVAVDKDNLEVRILELVGQFQTAEATADDDHALFIGLRYVESHDRM